MKQFINKLRGKTPTRVYLDEPTEEGYLLWPDTASAPPEKVRMADNERLVTGVHRPSIIYYPAAGQPMAAIIIAPGGSHHELWIDHEGHWPAKSLSERGIAAFVLKYRLGREAGSPYSVKKHSLGDILRAIRMVRSQAGQWGIHPGKIGVMGFSAGAELAALAASRYAKPPIVAGDPIDQQSSRPDFQVLVYPSRPKTYVVMKQSPPAFICGGFEDVPSITEESAQLYIRFKQMGVPAEMHYYAHAGHGFGIRPENKGGVALWPDRLCEWLEDSGFAAG